MVIFQKRTFKLNPITFSFLEIQNSERSFHIYLEFKDSNLNENNN